MDLAKYRRLFLEEGRENLAQLSDALLALEKDAQAAEPIDQAFRAAHSVKGMAATVGYEAVAELAHCLEDRLAGCRTAGRVEPAAIALLFEGLEGLERQLDALDAGESEPAGAPELMRRLSATETPAHETAAAEAAPQATEAAKAEAAPPKKAPRRP